jgi:uncharacterized membrane protein YeaQ/YmgE (transglycosylase-associated protein family)
MTILISLLIGLAVGCLMNYAITFRSGGELRNIGVCLLGALIGGALVPWILRVPTAWMAIIGSAVGIGVGLWLTARMTKKA